MVDTANDGTYTPLAFVENAHDLGILCIDVSSAIIADGTTSIRTHLSAITHHRIVFAENDALIKYYTLVSGGNSHDIKIWTITSMTTPKYKTTQNKVSIEHTGSCLGHKSAVTCLKYNNTGNYFLSSSLDKYIRIWDNDGACVATLKGHTRYVNSITFSRDGCLVASGTLNSSHQNELNLFKKGSSGSNDKTIMIWDLTGAITIESSLVKSLNIIGNALQNLQEMQVVQNAESSNTFELIEKIDDISEAAINSCSFFENDLLAIGSR